MNRTVWRSVLSLGLLVLLVANAAYAFDAPSWRERIRANHANADSLIALGAEAARNGHPREAVRAYEQAVAVAPARRTEIGGRLAYQYAWAGDLGRARREFARARAAHPEDRDLRRGELLVMNWMGDHLAAWKGYEVLVAENGELDDRAEAWVELATAQNWAGRRDLALRSTEWALHLDRGSRGARDLESTIRAGLRPRAGLFYDGAEDSDDYRVNGVWAEASVSPHPQLTLSPFANVQGIRRPDMPHIDETWAGITVSAQPFTRAGLWARAAWLTDVPSAADYAPLTGAATIDYRPHDRTRLGVSVERFAVVSYRAYPEKITGETYGLFVETRPDWLSRVRLSADRAFYRGVALADGTRAPANRRWNMAVAASRQVWAPARLRAGAMARRLTFDRGVDYGIWTPRRFHAAAGTLEWDWGTRDRWSLNGGLEGGAARENGGKTVLYAGYRLGAYRALGSFTLEFSAGHTEGNAETGTGYDRSYAHLGLRRRF